MDLVFFGLKCFFVVFYINFRISLEDVLRTILFLFVSGLMLAQSSLSEVSGPIGPGSSVGSAPNGRGGGGVVYYSDRVAFNAANPGLTCASFDVLNVAAAAVVGDPAPYNSSSSSVVVSPGDIPAGISFRDEPLNDAGGGAAEGLFAIGVGFASNANVVLGANTFVDAFDVEFTTTTRVFGANVHSLLGEVPVTVSIFDTSDALIDSVVVNATNAGVFFGFSSPDPVGRIEFEDLTDANAEGLSEYCFGEGAPPIPTMSQWGLILFVGLLAIGSLVLLRKTRKA